MPLSEHEQRMLEQIEQALYDEDPKFASSVRGNRMQRPNRRKRILGVALFLVGAALLPVGVMLDLRLAEVPYLSVFGFLMMFVGVVVALASLRTPQVAPDDGADGKDEGKSKSSRGSFAQRMEQRFKHRFDDR
ncbi:DUF3040 domain-containing protein [Haloechinothrix sp. YIM 98757]|uniref:DUF3040 domain-containing protein n=1 Tax=Haloechinothrix aidingensis TaxID=2752311 RepID=A0A838A7W4_9PSEU|nr:DUF3040 domain-containing protein [Haloechinothrix aidingensis]MBA0126140.1 DUF3040 domain-containing protein [Haloechinothrix aidingensis]